MCFFGGIVGSKCVLEIQRRRRNERKERNEREKEKRALVGGDDWAAGEFEISRVGEKMNGPTREVFQCWCAEGGTGRWTG